MQNLSIERDRNLSANTQVEDTIFKHLFIGAGTITALYNKGRRADVTLPYLDVNLHPVIIKGVELLRTGTRAVSIFVEPVIGDNVLLFALQHYIASLAFGTVPTADLPNARNYSTANIKGIVVQPNTENETVTDTYLHVDATGAITINAPATLNLTVNGATALTCKDKVDATIDGNTTLTTKGKCEISAKSDVDIKADGNCTVNSPNTKLTGGIVEIGGAVTPSGSGALCGIPACTFTGAPHVGNQSSGA